MVVSLTQSALDSEQAIWTSHVVGLLGGSRLNQLRSVRLTKGQDNGALKSECCIEVLKGKNASARSQPSTLCKPVQSKWMKIAREQLYAQKNGPPQISPNHFVRACAVEMHFKI